MFFATYQKTTQNLLRSVTFWLILAVLAIITVQAGLDGFYIGDDKPDFVLDFRSYVENCENFCGAVLMNYAIPVFCIFTAVLVLLRDHGDRFFEIEKAAGIRPIGYLLGRLSALATLNFAVLYGMNLLGMYIYIFTRGGVHESGLGEIIADSLVRILRLDFFVAFPGVLMYLGLTYCIGSIFKNGIPAAIASTGYVIFWYMFRLIFSWRVNRVFFDYLAPTPQKLRNYFHYYDSEWAEGIWEMFDVTVGDAAVCTGLLIGIGVLCSLVSYLCLRKRSL